MRFMKKISALALALVLVLTAFAACEGNENIENSGNTENSGDGGSSDVATGVGDEVTDEPQKPNYTEGLVFVSDLGGCFVSRYNGKSAEVEIPDEYEGQKVVRIEGSAFAGNENITSVKLGANVKKVGAAAFAGCSSLKRVDLGKSLEELGTAAFFGCTALEEVILPSKAKRIGMDCFADCESLAKIVYYGDQSSWSLMYVGENNEHIDDKLELADGAEFVKILYQGSCTADISWRLGDDGVIIFAGRGAIPNYDFDNIPWSQYSDEILGIVVENGIDIIGKNAFLGCSSVTKVTLAPSVKLIDDGAFSRCSSLEEIVIPERLRRIGNDAFLGCESLVTIELPDTVTAIGSAAFMDCASLESIKLSSAVTEIDKWSFANCLALKEIDLSGVTVIGANAFFRCKNLGKVTFSSKTETVGVNAFSGCPMFVKEGTIPQSAKIGRGNGVLK